MLEKFTSGRFLATVAVIGTLCLSVLMVVYFCLLNPELYEKNKELVMALIVCFTSTAITIINAYFNRTDRKNEPPKSATGGFISMKALIGLVVLSALAMAFFALPARAGVIYENGIVVTDDNVIIEDVYFRPFGLINCTVPWKHAQAVALIDVLHNDTRAIAGAEGSVVQQPLWGKVLAINAGIASVVTGNEKKGLGEVSFNLIPPDPNLQPTWSIKIWLGSAFDGQGPYGGYGLMGKFGK